MDKISVNDKIFNLKHKNRGKVGIKSDFLMNFHLNDDL